MSEHAVPKTNDIAQLHAGIRSAAHELEELIRANRCTGIDCTGCAIGRIQYQLLNLLRPEITTDTEETR